MSNRSVIMPSEIDAHLGLFDRFAGAAGTLVSRAPFFAASVLLVALWLIEGGIRIAAGGFKAFLDQTYQLQINTLTTIITFLLVALLQNTQTRGDDATQQKLNAIADALGDLMANNAAGDDRSKLHQDIRELRAAVGLEEREGSAAPR
jgi:low affinity Fe/Cu permease